MSVYTLTDKLVFPDPNLAEDDGLLAVGGDLTSGRLLLAYANGIFPWYSEGDPILWWSPNPRMVLFPAKLKVSKSLRQSVRNRAYEIKFDHAFENVIDSCSKVQRNGQNGTWITGEMKEAYIKLNKLGFAHSVEAYMDGKLTGGLYGISLGRAFFGESMFYYKRDASKIAFFHLIEKLIAWDFHFIDSQIETGHLKNLGAISIPRKNFLVLLKDALNYPTIRGKW
jgi:leucyl/phenylalanyl-tRNA---protein transferase